MGLYLVFTIFPSGARMRLGPQAPKILKLKALFSRGVPTEGSRGEALLETRRVGSTRIPQSFKPKDPMVTVSDLFTRLSVLISACLCLFLFRRACSG